MKRLRSSTTTICTVLIALFLLVVSPIVYDAGRMHSLRRRAKQIKVGDSKATVRQILGDCDGAHAGGAILPLVAAAPECWSYGSSFDWENCFVDEFPYFFPFRIRIFGPHHDDLVIEFDDQGNVSAVKLGE